MLLSVLLISFTKMQWCGLPF